MSYYIKHHGILGQKWGKQNGPPYPLKGGDYSAEETRKIRRKRLDPNSIYNKRHFDETLKADKTKLQTLSFNKDRTQGVDMFYASHKTLDNNVYKALLNQPVPKDILDENGNKIGTEKIYRFSIKNKLNSDIKVASEDSAAKIFGDLYKENRDFYNFVTEPDRMMKYFDQKRLGIQGYREAKGVLDKMTSNPDYMPTAKDIRTVYRLFNYVIPYDGGGSDSRGAADVLKQRTKFFSKLKEAGYGACLDTNDSIYNSLHAASPIIVFDMEQVIPDEVLNTGFSDRAVGIASIAFRKTFGV
ncbi:MAG: hypothetical protein J6Y02_22900 [Pseudobutyrivibrio sp.]|nr:hypothetical protein [Pseudobutyrivibrio sp.]